MGEGGGGVDSEKSVSLYFRVVVTFALFGRLTDTTSAERLFSYTVREINKFHISSIERTFYCSDVDYEAGPPRGCVSSWGKTFPGAV